MRDWPAMGQEAPRAAAAQRAQALASSKLHTRTQRFYLRDGLVAGHDPATRGFQPPDTRLPRHPDISAWLQPDRKAEYRSYRGPR